MDMMIRYVTKTYKTTSKMDVIDITGDAVAFISKAAVKDGLLTIIVPGSTASITTIEYEPGVVEDLKEALESIAPAGKKYRHDAAWGDGNGYSHVRAAFMKPSLSMPILEGRIVLGTWQQIVLCDFDNKSRQRKIVMQIIGA